MNYRLIILIIDSDNEPCYVKNREILRKYIHSYPSIQSFFVRASPDQEDPVRLEGDVLFWKGTESFYPGILNKTLAAMEYCEKTYTFDYILRTNLSSFWHLPRLLEVVDQLPKTNCVFSPYCRGYYILNTYVDFPSGCGFISSKDVIQQFISRRDLFLDTVVDDVSFGVCCARLQIPYTESVKYDFCTDNSIITQDMVHTIVSNGYYHYRVKDRTRAYDNQVFEFLYNAIYS